MKLKVSLKIKQFFCKGTFYQSVLYFLMVLSFFLSFFGNTFLKISFLGHTFSAYRLILAVDLILSFFPIIKGIFVQKRLPLYFLVFFLWIVVSVILLPFCRGLGLAVRQILIICSVAFMVLFSDHFCKRQTILENILFSLSIAVLINLLIGCIETFSGHYLNPDVYLNADSILYPQKVYTNIFGLFIPLSFFGNPNNFGLYCFISIFILLVLYFLTAKRWVRFYCLILSIFSFFISVCTDSRLSILCICLMLVGFIVFSLFSKEISNHFFLVVFGCLCLFFFALFSLYNGAFGPIDSGLRIRVHLLVDGLSILFQDSYGFGVGFGQVESYLSIFSDTDGIVNLHSFIFEILITSGVPFFTILSAFYLLTLKNLFHISASEERSTLSRPLSCFVSSFLVIFLFASGGPSHSLDWDFVWTGLLVVFLVNRIIFSSNQYCVFSDEIEWGSWHRVSNLSLTTRI